MRRVRQILSLLILVSTTFLWTGCLGGLRVEPVIGGDASPGQEERRTGRTNQEDPGGKASPKAVVEGRKALDTEEYEQAQAWFEEALAVDENLCEAWAGLAEAQAGQSQYRDAMNSYDQALTCPEALETWKEDRDRVALQAGQEAILDAKKAALDNDKATAEEHFKEAVEFMPESGLPHREWGLMLLEEDDAEASLAHFQAAVEAEPGDTVSWEWAVKAAVRSQMPGTAHQALAGFRANGGDPAVAAQLEALLTAGSALGLSDPKLREVQLKPSISRGDLAAMIATVLPLDRIEGAEGQQKMVLDIEDHWAKAAILACLEKGVLDEYPNHTFHPEHMIHRGDLARIAVRLLQRFKVFDPMPSLVERPIISDVPFGNLFYEDVALALTFDLMTVGPDSTFRLTDPVGGKDAVETLGKVKDLAWTEDGATGNS